MQRQYSIPTCASYIIECQSLHFRLRQAEERKTIAISRERVGEGAKHLTVAIRTNLKETSVSCVTQKGRPDVTRPRLDPLG